MSGFRIVDKQAGVEKCRAEGRCRICRRRTKNLAKHHLVPRSQGGDDVNDNLVPLCDPWEPWCHDKVTKGRPEAVRALRASLTADEVAYIVGKKGEHWLEQRYPSSSLADRSVVD